MPSAFPTWILFTCYFLNSWIWVSLGQGYYPKPAVQVIPGNVIIKGGNLTFRCTGDISGARFLLYQNNDIVKYKDLTGNEAEFHFTNVQPDHAGTYNCRYHANTYSDQSDPFTIQVRGTFPKPLLQVSPGNVSMRGRNLTFRCTGEQLDMRFTLRKGSEELLRVEPPGNQAVFTITNMKREAEERYDCFYQTKTEPLIYSDASDLRYIRVIDLPKASIALEPVQGVKGDYNIRCSAPESQNVKYFFLYEDGAEDALMDRSVNSWLHSVTFPVSKANPNSCRRCRCSYQIIHSGDYVLSPLSHLVSLDDKKKNLDSTEEDNEDSNEPEPTVESSNNGHDGQKKITPKPTDTSNTIPYTVIISVVCAALLLIVLIVTAVLYSRRRPKKTKGDIQKKGLCSIEGKTAALPETTYATIQKRKNPDATNVPEVRELEGTEDQEGLTYVTINQEACKKKRAAQPRSDQESTVYAAVNLH